MAAACSKSAKRNQLDTQRHNNEHRGTVTHEGHPRHDYWRWLPLIHSGRSGDAKYATRRGRCDIR
jgi:hypothetical protein